MRNKISRHNPTIQVSHSISQIRILCLYPYAVSASATQKKVETLELKMINLFIYLIMITRAHRGGLGTSPPVALSPDQT